MVKNNKVTNMYSHFIMKRLIHSERAYLTMKKLIVESTVENI